MKIKLFTLTVMLVLFSCSTDDTQLTSNDKDQRFQLKSIVPESYIIIDSENPMNGLSILSKGIPVTYTIINREVLMNSIMIQMLLDAADNDTAINTATVKFSFRISESEKETIRNRYSEQYNITHIITDRSDTEIWIYSPTGHPKSINEAASHDEELDCVVC
ncbi:MAG: hypothetical protein COA88_15935 [Kordia sp.]|nr:MAG: hypothetical protein COA88_15935 [Kordia sp.]